MFKKNLQLFNNEILKKFLLILGTRRESPLLLIFDSPYVTLQVVRGYVIDMVSTTVLMCVALLEIKPRFYCSSSCDF